MLFSIKNTRLFSIVLVLCMLFPSFSEWDIFASSGYQTQSDRISFSIGKEETSKQYSQEFVTKEGTSLKVTLRGIRISRANLFNRLRRGGPLSYVDHNTDFLSSGSQEKRKSFVKALENFKKDLPVQHVINQNFPPQKNGVLTRKIDIQTPEKYNHSGMDPPLILSCNALWENF